MATSLVSTNLNLQEPFSGPPCPLPLPLLTADMFPGADFYGPCVGEESKQRIMPICELTVRLAMLQGTKVSEVTETSMLSL